MSDGGRGRVTGVTGTVVLALLLLAGGMYLWTVRNGERLSDRNLRELARIGRGIEGQVNNLHTVLTSLAGADPANVATRAALIPHLSGPEVDTLRETPTRQTRLRLSPGLDHLELTYRGLLTDDSPVELRSRWSLESLRRDLVSDYFQMTLLANDSGTVIMSAPEATGIRIHSLAALSDSLSSRETETSGVTPPGEDATAIRSVTIAGRSYRVFVQPLRITLRRGAPGQDDVSGGTTGWLLAGLVPESRFTEERLALGPAPVLTLGLLLALGILAWPFVRAASMGQRERLGVRHLLYLVVSMIFVGGGIGFAMADLVYYVPFKAAVYAQTDTLADTLRSRVAREIDASLRQLDVLTGRLVTELGGEPVDTASSGLDPDTSSVLLKTSLGPDELAIYPILTMAFWADAGGGQIAKWTPRSTNTSRVSVADRAYYRSIRTGRAWRSTFPPAIDGASPDARADSVEREYFVESIRTWTTGEKYAAVSADASWTGVTSEGDSVLVPWVGVVLTRLASLDQPVLPAGVSFAVVDTAGHTLFHLRDERALEENLLEETSDHDLLRSTLRARAERDMDALYRGRRTRLFVRPFEGTPHSLVVILDKAQLETVHFETLFTSAALFAALCVLVMAWLAFVEVIVPRKMHWVWPDPGHPNRYFTLGMVLTLLLATLLLPVLWPGLFVAHLGQLLVPAQALGFGLVALSVDDAGDGTMRRARVFGWLMAVVAGVAFVVLQLHVAFTASTPRAPGVLLATIHTALTLFACAAVFLEHAAARDRPPSSPVLRRLEHGWLRFRARLGEGRNAIPLYLGAMVVGLLVVGALPGSLIYQLIFSGETELLIRHQQVRIAEALDARELRYDSIVRDDRLDPTYAATMRAQPYDLTFDGLVLGVCRAPATEDEETGCDFRNPPDGAPTVHPLLRVPLSDRVPFLSDASVEMRELDETQPDRSWSRGAPMAGPSLDTGSRRLGSAVPAGLGPPTLAWVLTLTVGIGLLFWIVRWVSRRIFLVDLWAPPPLTLDEALGCADQLGNMVVVCTRSTDRAALRARADHWDLIDLMADDVDGGDEPRLVVDDEKSVLCLDHCDHRIREGAWGRALLDFLEDRVYVRREPETVVLLTSLEPSALLEDERGSADEEYLERWKRLLGQFTRLAVRDTVEEEPFREELEATWTGPPSGSERDQAVSVLVKECRRPALRKIGLHIMATYPETGMARSELIGRIREEADTYYAALWAVLGHRERLVVAQLASGAIVNPSSGGAVARLLGRGILVRGPELRVMNESFERFVRDNAPESVIVEWERAGSASTWELIRVPFFMGWIALALFLFWTQRDLLGNTITFLSTVGVGLAAIGRVVTVFYSGPGSRATKTS